MQGTVKFWTRNGLGYRGDSCFILPILSQNAFTLVVAAKLVDSGFDDLHVALVVEVFLVFVHVYGEALSFLHEVGEVFRHGWG
jgi:hypothetical protein